MKKKKNNKERIKGMSKQEKKNKEKLMKYKINF